MELRHLRYFVTVAEELNFGRAAERLYISQPPLSRQIHQLEAEVGTPLFTRSNRSVELTDAGLAFLKDARSILGDVDSAVQNTRRIGRGEKGWFGVGFVPSAIYDVVPTILRRFREQYPDVELVLRELPGTEHWKALRDKQIHVGFLRLPLEENGIQHEPIARDTLMIALPSYHRMASCQSLDLKEMAHESFILFPNQPESHFAEYIIQICRDAGFEPNVVQKTGEIQTAVSLVAAGIGVVIVPSSARNLRREGVIYRPIKDPAPTIELTMSYRKDDPSSILPNFIKIAREFSSQKGRQSN